MFGKRTFSICREGWYFLFVLAFIVGGALLRDINLLLIVAGMMIGLLLFNVFHVFNSLLRLTVRRKLPHGVCAGDLLVVDIEATTPRRGPAAWAVVVQDRIVRDGASAEERPLGVEVLAPCVPRGQTVAAAYRGRLMRRGRYRFGPLRVSTRFPVGLVRRTITLDQFDELIVCPRLGRMLPRWRQVLQAEQVGNQGTQRRAGLLEGDFFGLRDWRSGDSRRWIHWRTSARRGDLTVRQFERPRNQDLALLVNLWQPKYASEEARDNVELAISAAATALADLCRRGGHRLLLGIAGQQVVTLRGNSSLVFLREVMEQLALAEASAEDRLPELLDRALEEMAPGTMTVLISTGAVDFSDTDRFSAVWDNPRKRVALGKILTIPAAGSELLEYYQVE